MPFRINRFTTIFLLFVLVLGVGYFLSKSAYKIAGIEKINQAPDWYMSNVTITRTNLQGKIKGILASALLTHHQTTKITDMKTPFFTVYDDNGTPWHITAKTGEAYHGSQKIFLQHHVIVKQLPGKDSNNMTLLTSSLNYYPSRSFAHTDKPVTIEQPESIMHSIGFNANLKKGTIKFLSPSTGDYDDTKSDAPNIWPSA